MNTLGALWLNGAKTFQLFWTKIIITYFIVYSLPRTFCEISLSLSLREIKISTMASQLLRRALGSHSNPSTAFEAARAFSSATTLRATLFPGDGIGPEIAESVKQVGPSLSLSLSLSLSDSSLSDSLCSPMKIDTELCFFFFYISVWVLLIF